MSDSHKEIENLKMHEELTLETDPDGFNVTSVLRVPGGLIYKFMETNGNVYFSIKSTCFVPFPTPNKNDKKILKS